MTCVAPGMRIFLSVSAGKNPFTPEPGVASKGAILMNLRRKLWLMAAVAMLAATGGLVPAEPPKCTGPLAGLPSAPGPHIQKIKALADNAWLKLGAPAPDPKWGKARGRSWGAAMPYAPDLNAAFLCGEGVHGWHTRKTNRYMDDLFVYDVNAHRWICAYPGADVKNVALKMNADGFEVDPDGQPIPVAQMGHGFAMVTYDTDRNKFMFMPCPCSFWLDLFGARRKSWGGHQGPFCPVNCSPWMYDAATGKFQLSKVRGAFPGAGNGSRIGVSIYLPSIKKLFFWTGGAKDAWLYDPKANAWSRITPKGPPPPFGIDANVCLDLKRQRVYFGGGYYPLAPGPNAFWCYDIKSNAWVDLQPKGKPCGGCNRYGPNQSIMHYDSVNDVVVLLYHRLPVAGTPDGDFNPGAKALGIYVYDPATNSWAETPQPMPKEIGLCPNAFYSQELNAHFIHCAGDSDDNGVMWAYRYRRTKNAK
jgi:hypothetical protein